MKLYDYIIIGAGSAGCVLANRLSADHNKKILLIEAGSKDNNKLLHIPGAYAKFFRKKYDWGYWTEPQLHVNNKKIYLPRGKVLGGSSAINAMAYVRGSKYDYDNWSKLGNKGWSFRDILPYFIKSEHNEQFYLVDRGYHGKNGLLNISFANKYVTPLAKAFVEAGQEVGIPYNPDFNGEFQHGTGLCQFTIKNEVRQSTATAFLKPVINRPNLDVMTNTQVKKIVVDQDRATGVEIFSGIKSSQIINASNEVIVSAGTFNSPQLLLLSGIGDPDELLQHQIQPVKHLAGVGKNLQDHVFCSVSATSNEESLNSGLKPLNQLKNLIKYRFGKNGPLTMSVLEAMAFVNLDDADLRPNFQFHFVPLHAGKGYDYDAHDISTLPKENGYSILPTLINPKSRGFVALKSPNPLDPPKIQPNFFQHPEDLQMMVKGVKLAIKIMKQSPFENFCKEIHSPPDTSSDTAIAEHVRQSLEAIYHPCGTCKMGNDPMSVVDDKLQVHGLKGLRVVDASIMPNIVSGNTNAPVVMIAEKASEMILES